jgi:signal peptidase I
VSTRAQRATGRSAAEVAEPARPAAPAWRKSALRDNFEAVATAVLFAVFVRGFIAQPYKIPSGSMEETLLVGDHLVVNKVVYGEGAAKDGSALLPTMPVRRGDVVIFRPPIPEEEESDYIKRVIGLPGDEIRLLYSPKRNGVRVIVNGQVLPERYRTAAGGPVTPEEGARWTVNGTGEAREGKTPGWNDRTIRLGPDEYWMMGDNRNNSEDSRVWGPVRSERIRGRAWFIYWSYEGEPGEPRSLGEQVALYLRIAWGFFTHSRWSRTLDVIH